MENKTTVLGRSNLQVSRIGFGCYPIGGKRWGQLPPKKDILRTLCLAAEQGITLFDTAPIYGFGQSEEMLGAAFGRRGLMPNANIVIATKFGLKLGERGHVYKDNHPDRIADELHLSLKRLGRDSIDLYQMHWPDDAVPLADICEKMERFKEQGLIRAYGACNLGAADLSAELGITTLQNEYSLLATQEAAVFDRAKTCQMGTLAYRTLGRGILSGKYSNKAPTFGKNDLRRKDKHFGERFVDVERKVGILKQHADELDLPTASLALAWTMQQDNIDCTLVGIKNALQLEQAIRAMNTQSQLTRRAEHSASVFYLTQQEKARTQDK